MFVRLSFPPHLTPAVFQTLEAVIVIAPHRCQKPASIISQEFGGRKEHFPPQVLWLHLSSFPHPFAIVLNICGNKFKWGTHFWDFGIIKVSDSVLSRVMLPSESPTSPGPRTNTSAAPSLPFFLLNAKYFVQNTVLTEGGDQHVYVCMCVSLLFIQCHYILSQTSMQECLQNGATIPPQS